MSGDPTADQEAALTTSTRLVLQLADAYANACFEQGLNRRVDDPAPEIVRRKLAAEVARLQSLAEPSVAKDDEARRQLLHLIDDIVEETEKNNVTHYQLRTGRELIFSNFVAACRRLIEGDIAERSAPEATPVATLWREKNQDLYPGPIVELTAAGEALPLGVKHKLFAGTQKGTS